MKPTITSSTLAMGSIEGTVTIDSTDATGHIAACGGNDANDLTAFMPTAAVNEGPTATGDCSIADTVACESTGSGG